MPILTVKQACRPSELVQSDSLAEQIAELSDLRDGAIDPDRFFRRNHFTEGMERLLYNGFKRLSGQSEVGAYYLSQAMGGGKTHSLIAFALLAAHPSVRRRVAPRLHPLCAFDRVRSVVFNGHDGPDNFLWGYIADRLEQPAAFAKFWKDGARAPGAGDWIGLIGDEPTLILLDELPFYLQQAQGRTVGATTLAHITIGALETLFAALPRLPRTCILLTNLRNDVYRETSNAVRAILDNLNKQAGKYAEDITPVRQNSGEIFQIIRKQLFDDLPDEDRIDELAQAYVEALNKAKKLDAITALPETFLQRIRESYPFHPSLRDIVARFKENAGYQQTRALIRILRHAVRAAWAAQEPVFLIGLQHLDLNVPGAMEEIRKINPNFTNAIARDIADNGNALAERLDAGAGNRAATQVAKLLLMSSLSSAQDPVLGLRDNEVTEYLLDPLTKVSEIQDALAALRRQGWYLFTAAGDQRVYVGQTANVLAQIQEVAAGLAEEMVDKALRAKLAEVFQPREKKCYHEIIYALPALDDLQTVENQVRLVILEQPADRLPEAFQQWWRNDERPNRVLVLTADANAVGTMRTLAREYHATVAVQKAVAERNGRDSNQYREASDHLETTAGNFLSAVREAFKTVVFPSSRGLRSVNFDMEFKNNDYNGEQQIVNALVARSKYYTEELFDQRIDSLRLDAENDLFSGVKAVPEAELRRKAAAFSGWVWLPPNGLERLVRECVNRGFWRHANGVVEKGPFPKVTAVKVGLEETREEGLYVLSVTPVDGDVVHVSETGPPSTASQTVSGGRWETYGPVVRFLTVDSHGEAATGEPCEWRAPFELTPSLSSTPAGTLLSVRVLPRGAEVLATFDGSSPKDGQPLREPLPVPDTAQRIRLIARAAGAWSEEIQLDPPRPGSRDPAGDEINEPRRPRDDLPVLLKTRQTTTSTQQTYTALEAMKNVGGVTVLGGKLDLKGDSDKAYCEFRFGDGIAIPAHEVATVLERLRRMPGITAAGAQAATAILCWHKLHFETGRAFCTFAEQAGLDWERLEWDHDSVKN